MSSARRIGLWPTMLLLALVGACSSPQADPADAAYRVQIEGCGGADFQRATAVAIEPDLAATVAHSFDQAKAVSLRSSDGQTVKAELIYLDAAKDIALLQLTPSNPNAVVLGGPSESGAVSITTYADEVGPATKSGSIVDLVDATLDGEGRRSAIKLKADIQPGDSGAAVMEDGEMVGMIFATSRNGDFGWALASSEVADAVANFRLDGPTSSPLAC